MPDLLSLVRQHGGNLYDGGRRAVIPGPGHSRRDRSLSLMMEGSRVVFHSLAGDSVRDVMAYLGLDQDERRPVDKAEQARLARAREAERRIKERDDLAFCEAIWKGATPLRDTPAEAYLASRGLRLSSCPDLRFHPAAPRCKPRMADDARSAPAPHPALVALVRDVTGAARGLHVTYVRANGAGKAFGDRSRLMFGPVAGGSVRLFPMGADGHLAAAEGIETAASYAGLWGIPTWATLSTAGLQTFRVPGAVKHLTIAADCDDGGAGMEAANLLASRARCPSAVHEAPLGSDWGDVWEARQNAP